MSIEQAMLVRAQPQMVQRKLGAMLTREVSKGCTLDIGAAPVRLEPSYAPLFSTEASLSAPSAVPEAEMTPADILDLRVWVSPEQNIGWDQSELFLKALSAVSRRMSFQIVGNQRRQAAVGAAPTEPVDTGGGISLGITCQPLDASTVETVFRGQFSKCEVTRGLPLLPKALLDPSQMLGFVDVFPLPPYSHLLTSYEELKTTPFSSLLEYLAAVPPPSVGFYQCIFQPVAPSNDWHRNVEGLLDMEYMVKLHNGVSAFRQMTQQAPSGDLHQMARDVVTKAHNDKPFFCAAVRIGLIGPIAATETNLAAISAFIRVFQHGGRPLQFLTHKDYERVLPTGAIRRMIAYGATYRPGFLVNSGELAGLVNIPSPKQTNPWRVTVSMDVLETLPVRNEELLTGTFIGTCNYAGTRQRVCIPHGQREKSTHIIGAHGSGKSTIIEHCFYQDIHDRGIGAALIDFHGDTVKKVMRIIEPRLYDKCIYFNPGDPKGLPLWNPLRFPVNGDRYRYADEVLGALKRIFDAWGQRMAALLRNGIIGLSYLPGSTFFDLYMLTRQKSRRSDELRHQIVKHTTDEAIRTYWETDFLKDYTRGELVAAKHSLSPLMIAGNVSLMLSQPESVINIREVMDEGKILLVDLSLLGRNVAKVMGSFMLGLFLSESIGRGDTADGKRRPFSLFVDEAHLFAEADAIEEIVSEARKFSVNLTIAHQYLSQFRTSGRVDALSTVGSTLIGRMDKRDSEYFAKDCQDMAGADDIRGLKPFEIIARIGQDIVRVKTPEPRAPLPGDGIEAIKRASRAKYCKSAEEIRATLAARQNHWGEAFTPLTAEGQFAEEELKYDEF
jgi:hypothetical protein